MWIVLFGTISAFWTDHELKEIGTYCYFCLRMTRANMELADMKHDRSTADLIQSVRNDLRKNHGSRDPGGRFTFNSQS